jgi:anti-sigma factor RsiW
MNCHEAALFIAAAADGELAHAESARLTAHIRHCATCAAAQEQLASLRERLRRDVPYHPLPPGLRARILDRVRRDAPPRPARGWPWFAAGALGGSFATVLAWVVTTALIAERDRSDLVQQAVTAHVGATARGEVIAVVSTDEHTVKPWLSARLDYSPPVPRVDATGFVLTGGRLDRLDGQPVATLVYRYRDHVVDVFVRPTDERAHNAPPRTIRGFNVVEATGHAMEWVIVSDVNLDALRTFAAAVATAPDARER